MPNESVATGHDQPRPDATDRDSSEYTLSIEDVAARYEKAGHPRTIRTLQRYCVSGHLSAQKIATTLGDKYLVTPQSVARHIAQLDELSPRDNVATNRGEPRPDATENASEIPRTGATPTASTSDNTARQTPSDATTGGEKPRQTATDATDMSQYVARLEREVENANDEKEFYREQAKEERSFYREQIDRKDKTIDALLERDHETNILMQGLQAMFPRLAQPRTEPPPPPDQQQQQS